jgi:phage gpG-like protein
MLVQEIKDLKVKIAELNKMLADERGRNKVPEREWVGLTDEERKQIVSYINDPFEWSHAVEAKLKEKNT